MAVTDQTRSGDLAETFKSERETTKNQIRVALPGIVQSFDPGAVTAVVQPAIRSVETDNDGNCVTKNYPLLVDVPVIFPRGGGCTLTFPVKAGDECLVIFADRCIDFWWQNGGVQEPVDDRVVALVALAIHDANNTAISVYNCFSPATGYGAALTSNVKINGIARRGATNSTVDLVLTGTAGTSITNGTVKDTNNVIWRLPASVTIGVGGTVTVTATCSNSGAVAALAGTITTINTPSPPSFDYRA